MDKHFYSIYAICITVIVVAMVFSESCKSSERIRFYDTSDGWAKPTYEFAEKQWDGSYRIYDSKGRFQGKVTKDRLYDNKGRVQEKFYLFHNR